MRIVEFVILFFSLLVFCIWRALVICYSVLNRSYSLLHTILKGIFFFFFQNEIASTWAHAPYNFRLILVPSFYFPFAFVMILMASTFSLQLLVYKYIEKWFVFFKNLYLKKKNSKNSSIIFIKVLQWTNIAIPLLCTNDEHVADIPL